MADATPDELEGERIEALVDVHQQAVVAPVALGREVDDETRPLTRRDRLQIKDKHVSRSHSALFACLLIKDVVCRGIAAFSAPQVPFLSRHRS